MKILGLSGGFDYVYEQKFCHQHEAETEGVLHDSAAALLINGTLFHGIEEERLNRIKHTNKLSVNAVNWCLSQCDLLASEIDFFAIYESEVAITAKLRNFALLNPKIKMYQDARSFLSERWSVALKTNISTQKFRFVEHHYTHALLAHLASGFEESLIITLDGAGDFISGSISIGIGQEISRIDTISCDNSLGLFYSESIRYLGYQYFDEYKVMGLASYGDPITFRNFFSEIVKLLPDGKFTIQRSGLFKLYNYINPRRHGEKFIKQHADLAAGIQETLENVVIHILRYYKELTKCNKLCLSGGVALNCVMNGRIAKENLFDDIFIPPAPHDGGCAIGAALATHINESQRPLNIASFTSINLGGAVETDNLETIIYSWESAINIAKTDQLAKDVSKLLANGAIIGWISGKSEFGPRALGARSILADPRSSETRDRVNSIIKRREDFRPLAPAVLSEALEELFELPNCIKRSPFMSFALPIRDDWKDRLSAVCHNDGTARVQSVEFSTNPIFWDLINEFKLLTNVPALLNTSFNCGDEPIVESIQDAIATFLTSEIDALAVGTFILTRKKGLKFHYLDGSWIPILRAHLLVSEQVGRNVNENLGRKYWLTNTCSQRHNKEISSNLYKFLSNTNGKSSIDEIITKSEIDFLALESILSEIWELWAEKKIELIPNRSLSFKKNEK